MSERAAINRVVCGCVVLDLQWMNRAITKKSWECTAGRGPPPPLLCDLGWVVYLVVVEDEGQWGRRQKQ